MTFDYRNKAWTAFHFSPGIEAGTVGASYRKGWGLDLRFEGERSIGASRDSVWQALHDEMCLALCLPGHSSLRRISPTRFELALHVSFGPVSVPFAGTVEILEEEMPKRMRLEGRGETAFAGRLEGTTEITLRETGYGCRATYVVEAALSGPLSMLVLTGAGRGLAERFARRFAASLAQACSAVAMRRPGISTAPRGLA